MQNLQLKNVELLMVTAGGI